MSGHPSRDHLDSEDRPRIRRRAWFHCFAGIAGDMALGSLIDAGADLDELRKLLDRLPIGGWSFEVNPVLRGGIASTQVEVRVGETGVVRTFPHVIAILEEAKLPARVQERSMSAFSALASVEGRLHRRPTAQVHFHELGGHDTVVDVVGTAAALEILEIDEVTSSPVALGHGAVRTRHGMLPNPAPAVLALLAGAPVFGRELNVELTTPTGAAIVASMASSFGAMPPMAVDATGYGAGSHEIDGLPNCTQVVVGRPLTTSDGPLSGQPLVVIEANLDDATGEQLADALNSLLDAGAIDAWVTPVVMKKGRPGHVISALCESALVDGLTGVLMAETGTLGVRAIAVGRTTASRSLSSVEVDGVPLRVKVSPGRVKIEHDDAAALAKTTGQSVRKVVDRAEREWWRRTGAPADDPDEDA
jgi:pyridinium-3,5-bisthiocarboxylic acid mononucleotide nickel chelatase